MDPLFKRARLLARPTLDWLRAWPWFVASIVLGFLIEENFPFSHWPMYSISRGNRGTSISSMLLVNPSPRRRSSRPRPGFDANSSESSGRNSIV